MEPIRTEREYELAIRQIEDLWEAEPGSADADQLDALTTLVDAYEEKEHFPIGPT